jgi:hypothetical protein
MISRFFQRYELVRDVVQVRYGKYPIVWLIWLAQIFLNHLNSSQMQDYVNFLLEDIAAAHRPKDYFKKKRKNTPEEDFEESLQESEMIVSEERRPGFEGYCGLKHENFPPVE